MFVPDTNTHKIPAKNANPIPSMTKTKINTKAALFLLENIKGCNITDQAMTYETNGLINGSSFQRFCHLFSVAFSKEFADVIHRNILNNELSTF